MGSRDKAAWEAAGQQKGLQDRGMGGGSLGTMGQLRAPVSTACPRLPPRTWPFAVSPLACLLLGISHTPGRPGTPTPDARGCLPASEAAQLAPTVLGQARAPQPGSQARLPVLPPSPPHLSHRTQLDVFSTRPGPRGAWAEAGRQTCLVWLSTGFQKNPTWLPTLKSREISHKNPDFWLLLTNQRSLAARAPYS